jgi:hypothetical protein
VISLNLVLAGLRLGLKNRQVGEKEYYFKFRFSTRFFLKKLQWFADWLYSVN